MNNNIIPHLHAVTKSKRQASTGHRSLVIWFTGLSGSGKSTLAGKVEELLFNEGVKTYILDGDNIRTGLNNNLGFSQEDRKENIRRIGEVAKLFVDAGTVVLTAFISPFREDRNSVRNLLNADEFIEIYVKCSIEICEQRDVKGLYKKARKGEINDFTGINSPYEEPTNPELTVETDKFTAVEITHKIADYIIPKIIKRNNQ